LSRSRGYYCFDGAEAFTRRLQTREDLVQLYHGHYSHEGNEVPAEELHRYLETAVFPNEPELRARLPQPSGG